MMARRETCQRFRNDSPNAESGATRMDPDFSPDQSRLSRIETHWSLVRQAHEDEPSEEVIDAKQALLLRYAPAIRRYLGAALRDPDSADEVFQEFAVKFVRGDFRSADPQQGRFRQFVKTSLYRLIVDHHRQRQKTRRETGGLSTGDVEPLEETPPDARLQAADEALLLAWRDELLGAAWDKLQRYSIEHNAAFYAVLRLRVENPQWSSEQLAEQVSEVIDRPLNSGAVRAALHRARERFAHLLLDALSESLESPDHATLEAEVVELRLLDYCRDALTARKQSS